MNVEVYKAINAIQADLIKQGGIAKDRKANGYGANYSFRGIDDMYNVLSPLLAKHELVIIPRHMIRTCDERTNAKGTALFYVQVESEYDIVSAKDGSIHQARAFGEAMDSGDKATNKAMSASYKYMCMQVFAIPTEGDNDPDGTMHQPITSAPTSKGRDKLKAAQKENKWAASVIKDAATNLKINPSDCTIEEADKVIASIKQVPFN